MSARLVYKQSPRYDTFVAMEGIAPQGLQRLVVSYGYKGQAPKELLQKQSNGAKIFVSTGYLINKQSQKSHKNKHFDTVGDSDVPH